MESLRTIGKHRNGVKVRTGNDITPKQWWAASGCELFERSESRRGVTLPAIYGGRVTYGLLFI